MRFFERLTSGLSVRRTYGVWFVAFEARWRSRSKHEPEAKATGTSDSLCLRRSRIFAILMSVNGSGAMTEGHDRRPIGSSLSEEGRLGREGQRGCHG